MTKMIEAVRQLRGEAHPAVQVPDCQLALAHGTGGSIGTRMGSATLILGRSDEALGLPAPTPKVTPETRSSGRRRRGRMRLHGATSAAA